MCSYGQDFVLQEAIEQHDYLRQFSKTSSNTLRVMTYRSVIDDEVMLMAAALRIGQNGSFVDNLFSGGCFAPIDLQTGKLGNELYDRYWRVQSQMNGIDFANNEFVLPFWNEACEFAKNVARQIPYARLLALDVIVDVFGKPRLIEFNVDDFDWSMAMACTRTVPFGTKFFEVIEYCLRYKNDLS